MDPRSLNADVPEKSRPSARALAPAREMGDGKRPEMRIMRFRV